MIITVAFGKGGTGKTSTACAIVNYAKQKGKSVLAVDCDPQSNFTYALGGDASKVGLYDVITNRQTAGSVIQTTPQSMLIPAGLNLAAAETEILNRPGRDFILKKAIEPLKKQFDLVVVDTQPDLGVLLVNALFASDAVLLPMQANSFSIMGLYQMENTISQVNEVRESLNTDPLQVLGIVLTKYKPRQTLATDLRESIEEQAQAMGTKLLNTYIREAVAVEQAQALQKSLFEYAPRSNAAIDYAKLCDELKLF